MADTTYVDDTTEITADSMNDFNRLHYTILGDPADLTALKDTLHSAPGPVGDGTPSTGAFSTLSATGDFTYKTAVVGAWTTPTFAAGDFTGGGSQTWTVAAGDVSTYAYTITGKTMTVAFTIITSTVGGTPNADLNIAIPASKTATKAMSNACYLAEPSSNVIARCRVSAAGTIIVISKIAGTNLEASTNGTSVIGQITFEIN